MIPPRAVWKIRPSRGGAVPLDVGAQQFHQFGRVGDGTGLMDGAVLQAAFLPGCDSAGGLPGTAEPHSDFRLGALRVPRLPHSFSCCVYPGAAMFIQVPRSGARIAVPCHGQTREGKRADWPGREAGGPYSSRHSFRAACSAPRRRACRPALSAGRPARSAGSPGRARPAGLAGRSASARRPGRSRGGGERRASWQPDGDPPDLQSRRQAAVTLAASMPRYRTGPERRARPAPKLPPPGLGEAGAAAEHALIAARPRTALTRRRRRTRTGDYSCLSVSARSGLTMDAR